MRRLTRIQEENLLLEFNTVVIEWNIILRKLTRIQEENLLLECWQYDKLFTSNRYTTVEKTVPRREELVGNGEVSQILLHQLVNAGHEGAELGGRNPVVHGIVVVMDNGSQGVPQVVN